METSVTPCTKTPPLVVKTSKPPLQRKGTSSLLLLPKPQAPRKTKLVKTEWKTVASFYLTSESKSKLHSDSSYQLNKKGSISDRGGIGRRISESSVSPRRRSSYLASLPSRLEDRRSIMHRTLSRRFEGGITSDKGQGRRKRPAARPRHTSHGESPTPSDTHDNTHDHSDNTLSLGRFRNAAKLVMRVIQLSSGSRAEQTRRENKLLSFRQLQNQYMVGTRRLYGNGELTFDPADFKARREERLSQEARTILQMEPVDRTPEQIRIALRSINTVVESFSEFPIKLQKSLISRAVYERFEAKRVIIRQCHLADNFYLIISGQTEVTIMTTDPVTGDSLTTTVAILGRGNSFGELALMHGGTRTATVTCQEDVELLAIGRDDFIDIFMHVDAGNEPEHIQHLRQIEALEGWPIERLPHDDPKICLFTYFRRGVVMCHNSNQSDWVYFVISGSCRVIKALKPRKKKVRRMDRLPDITEKSRISLTSRSVNQSARPVVSYEGRGTGGEEESIPMRSRSRSMPTIMVLKRRSRDNRRVSLANTNKSWDNRKDLSAIAEESDDELTPRAHRTLLDVLQGAIDHPVFVELNRLGPRDTCGLDHIAYELTGGATPVSLVSEGAEVVLISRKFFRAHVTDTFKRELRKRVTPYPSEGSLLQQLQDYKSWRSYKKRTVKSLYNDLKKVESVFPVCL